MRVFSKIIYSGILLLLPFLLSGIDTIKINIYLLHGQGADSRMFKNIKLIPQTNPILLDYGTPPKGEDMNGFARTIAEKIDTITPYVIIGVSLGGMLATEMADFLNPEKVILISSAKTRKELPGKYKTFFHRLVPGWLMKGSALILQPIVEPDRNKDKPLFVSMLKKKTPRYFKRTVGLIASWKRETYPKNIIHIHGDKDNTIPIKKVKYDFLVKDGSHMMTVTKGQEIGEIINTILKDVLLGISH